ncbi:hypothetical protein DE146DRAFT_673879 [Phaeosphaeria sp. MPI-PUGE-AT-0046c]|nr:hypothetical protein DE146DRAFT_673879 [Phaeosphaeria sp. MPI-PUGE-AT-0046c]
MDNRARAGNTAQNAPANAAQPPAANAPKIQQPKPQALPSRSGPSSILVSPRQKGNPILNNVRTVAWEYSDIPADYVVGATTCALFLSLKYHRLHPEYIYNRIRDLKGQYNLRILLTMVDIENHEEPLKELSKTSLVNNVTVMLCWSAQEAGRYLELFKTFENAAPTGIRAQQSNSYSEKMVEFITVPRSINKTDAVGLVSNFGSIRTAINAGPEEIGLIAGWGDKKVQRWANAVREPFRVKKAAARRGPSREDTRATMSRDVTIGEGERPALDGEFATSEARETVDRAVPIAIEIERTAPIGAIGSDADKRADHLLAEDMKDLAEDEEAMREAENGLGSAHGAGHSTVPKSLKKKEDELSDGVMAALSRHLNNTDLKAVRGVSRKLRDNASPSLFRSVVACARYEALGAFQKVTEHPVLGKYVHEIVFDGSVFCTWLASSSDQYKTQNNKYDHLRTGSYYFIRERWKRYKELGVLLQTIAKALSATTNVSRLTYSPSSRLVPVERKTVRDLVPRDYRMDIDAPGRYPMRDNVSRKNHPFRQLIGAIYAAQYTGGVPFTFDLLDCPDPETDLKAGQFLFQHLEKCELNIKVWPMRNNMPTLTLGTQRAIHLESLTGAARDLRHVALHVNCGGPEEIRFHIGNAQPEELRFHRLGLNTTWPLFTGTWASIVDEALCHTRILPFVLSSVNEVQVPSDPGMLMSSAGLDEWKYEGHIEVSEDGERAFVDLVPTKRSVYSRLL